VITSRRIGWAGYVTRRGRGEVYAGFWWGNLRERDDLEEPRLERRILTLILLTWRIW